MPKRSLWRSIAGVFLLIATIVCCAALAANLANGAEDEEKRQAPKFFRARLTEMTKETIE